MNFTRKIFFEPRIFLRKMLRNFPRYFFCGSGKNPRKIPSKFPTKFSKFPCEKSKKFTDELLQERREKIVDYYAPQMYYAVNPSLRGQMSAIPRIMVSAHGAPR